MKTIKSVKIENFSEIIENLKHPLKFGRVLRPELNDENDKSIKGSFPMLLIDACWAENPTKRPTIESVRKMVDRETRQ